MTKANLSVVMSALDGAPIIVWSVSAQHKSQLVAGHTGPLSPAVAKVHTGAGYFAAFAQASPRAAEAIGAAFAGKTQTICTHNAAQSFCTHFKPHRTGNHRISRVDAITTIMPPVHAAPEASAASGGLKAELAAPQKVVLRLMQQAPVAASLMRYVGNDLIYVFANPMYESLMQAGHLAQHNVCSEDTDAFAPKPQLKEALWAVAHRGVRHQTQRQQRKHLPGAPAGRIFAFLFEPVLGAVNTPCDIAAIAYDVTKYADAQRLAQTYAQHIDALADSMPQIVWMLDAADHICSFNQRWYEYTGLPKESADANDAAWRRLCHPDDRPRAWAAWTEACKTGKAYSYQSRLYDRRTKTHKWFMHQGTPARDASGHITAWFGSSTNIDAEKRGKDQVDNVIESMTDAFFAVDAHWRITRVNAKLEQVSKISREQQIGRNFLELYLSKPADKLSAYWRNYRKAMQERQPMSFEEYYAPLNLWTEVNVYPSDDGGLAVFFRDVSQERLLHREVLEEKQKFEAIFSDSPACMALLRGPELIFEKVNTKYAQLMGRRALLGKALHDAVPELVGQPFFQLMRHVLDTGEPYVANEMAAHLVRTIGSPPEACYFDFTYTRVEDGCGRPYGVYIHATDITEKVMVRNKTARLTDRLSAAVQSRDEFLCIASHELKTPVTSLKMQLQMTRRAVKPDEDKAPPPTKLAKTLDLCCRQVDRLTALIEDLLDVSRVESGKLTFNFEPTNLTRLLDEVVARFDEQLKTAGCTIDTHYTSNMWIDCDGFRIEQVVINLLSNAMKYGAGTPVHIEASLGPQQEARIVVRDEGMGIAKDMQQKVFDRFERAISYNNVSGLGLGLYISKQIVDAHDGQIFVESDLGCGATFTVALPRHAAAPQRPGRSGPEQD